MKLCAVRVISVWNYTHLADHFGHATGVYVYLYIRYDDSCLNDYFLHSAENKIWPIGRSVLLQE
jgi:hypothetical protein